MAMQIGSGGGDDDVVLDINTTPLIDVMLVLLIMLIITIPIQTHAVKLDMPVGAPPTESAAPPPEVVVIDVDFDGVVLFNGQEIAGRADLEGRLQTLALAAVPPEVHLRPHKLVSYKHVAAVLATAQRLGVNKLGLIGNEQFLD